MKLNDEDFHSVIKNTPLIAMDLIVRAEDGKILLGRRVHSPAKGMWFVPGGRIMKGEQMTDAFARITKTEIGREIDLSSTTLIGLFDHFYFQDNFYEDGVTDTQYVAIAFGIHHKDTDLLVLSDQHDEYAWKTREEIVKDNMVHPYTKQYLGINISTQEITSDLDIRGD